DAGLDRHAAILELRVLVQHVQALLLILAHQRNARALQRLASTISRPRPQEIAPGTYCCSVQHRRCLTQPMRLRHINRVAIAIPHQLDSRERVIPAKVHAADSWPWARELALLDGDGFLGHREDATAA